MNGNVLMGAQRGPILERLEAWVLLDATGGGEAIQLFSASPALFVENQGQWADASVRYAFHGSGTNVALTDTGAVFQVFQREAGEEADTTTRGMQFSSHFDGANGVSPVGLDQAETVVNYCLGDPADWQSNVPTYQRVAYMGLYDGIDMQIWGRRDSLKYEFHVAPGADYRRIRISYDGIEGLSMDAEGALHVGTELGELIDDAPYVYQDIGGRRVEVAGRFELLDADTYTFRITGDYDAGAELVIDPVLDWSTYLGGSLSDAGNGIAVDGDNNVLVTGETGSSGWVSGGSDTTFNGGNYDAFVAKISPAGQHVWSTYVGGSSNDHGYGIAVDGDNNVLVAGQTASDGWVSLGFDTTYNGDPYDAFVAKISPTGQHVWSTYLGGSDDDCADGIAADGDENVLVAGETASDGWVSLGFDTTYNGGDYDAFVAKISPTGQHVWSTYLGGSEDDSAVGFAVDGDNNALATGETASDGWVSLGFDTTYNGGDYDAFVAKISPTGQHVWSTYLGGSENDDAEDVAVDGDNNLLVAGDTASSGWVSLGFDTTYNGGDHDAFVAKISPTGQHVWSTYLGGSEDDDADGIAVGGGNNVFVTGQTSSSGWVSGGFDTTFNGGSYDAFVAKISPAGQHVWSSYLGGSAHDEGDRIAVDGHNNLLVTGATSSSGWVSGGFDTSFNGGGEDAFVAKIRDQTWETGGPGDFNGDGHADILWRNTITGQVGAWLMVSGAFSSWQPMGAVSYAAWEIGGIGDFNADGHADILWRNKTTGTLGAWLLVSGVYNSWQQIGAVPYAGWEIGGVGDFNADTHADILWRNRTSGQVGAWRLVNGVFNSWQQIGAVPYADWEIGGIGDFNADGHADILWRNKTTGQVGAWLLVNGVFNSWQQIGAVPYADWEIGGVGDLNGDGPADILWRNKITGQVGAWLMVSGVFDSWLAMGMVG